MYEFEQPSNPKRKAQFREYTVADAMKLASVNRKLTEKFTSSFLKEMQCGEDIIDPLYEMSEQDRATLVFQYGLTVMSSEQLDQPATFELEGCSVCGKNHDIDVSVNEFRRKVRIKKDGKPKEIETTFEEQKLLITPLLGIHLEDLEKFDLQLERIKQKEGAESENYLKLFAQRREYHLLSQLTLSDHKTREDLTDEQKAEADKKWLYSLKANQLEPLENLIGSKQELLQHGISQFYIAQCPNAGEDQEGDIPVMLSFQFVNYIP